MWRESLFPAPDWRGQVFNLIQGSCSWSNECVFFTFLGVQNGRKRTIRENQKWK
jgi:hypothetical protein